MPAVATGTDKVCDKPIKSELGLTRRVGRCSLTSLAVTNPYVLKRCESCARVYIDETRLQLYYAEAVTAGSISRSQAETELRPDKDGVEWMLRAVTCIYCGGKFIRYV